MACKEKAFFRTGIFSEQLMIKLVSAIPQNVNNAPPSRISCPEVLIAGALHEMRKGTKRSGHNHAIFAHGNQTRAKCAVPDFRNTTDERPLQKTALIAMNPPVSKTVIIRIAPDTISRIVQPTLKVNWFLDQA